MKQNKKTKLALSKQVVRSMSAVAEAKLGEVGGGSFIHTKILSQCDTNNTGYTCPG
jgi:hypothetical protein